VRGRWDDVFRSRVPDLSGGNRKSSATDDGKSIWRHNQPSGSGRTQCVLTRDIGSRSERPQIPWCVTVKNSVCPVAPERIWKWGGGHRSGEKRRKIFFVVLPLHFLALKAQLVVLVSAFVMVSTVWPVSCLLFFYWWCPRAPWSRRHCVCQYGDLELDSLRYTQPVKMLT